MFYTTMIIDGKEYKLKLTTKALIDVEQKLGENPLNLFMQIGSDGKMPTMSSLMCILWGAMQPYNHNISISAVYDLFDKWIEDGNTLMDIVPVFMEVFKVSGFLENDKETKSIEDEEKN